MSNATATPKKANRIALGSGKLYAIKKTDSIKLTSQMTIEQVIAFVQTNATNDNLLGRIKNGATFKYSTESYKEADDLNEVSKQTTTSETVTLGAGMITFDGAMLNKIIDTAAHTTDEKGNEMIAGGGLENAKGDVYVLIFVHKDKVDGDIYALIHGKNTAEVALSFQKSEGTLSSPEFTGEPFDTAGRSFFIVNCAPAAQNESTEQA